SKPLGTGGVFVGGYGEPCGHMGLLVQRCNSFTLPIAPWLIHDSTTWFPVSSIHANNWVGILVCLAASHTTLVSFIKLPIGLCEPTFIFFLNAASAIVACK